MNKSLKKIWNVISSILVALVVILALLLVGARVVGLQVFTVLSGSMEPTYHTGSLIYVKKVDPYELPPRTQFSMLNKPSVTFKHRQMTFNMASVRLFEGVKYILPFTSSSKKRVAVVTCSEEESESVEWVSRNAKGAWVNKTITSDEYVSKVFKFMHWDLKCRYKVMGRVANSERGLILVFDLSEAILFTPLEEYVDKQTGEIKKRQIKYYPDEYKERIGKTYRDYAEKYQMSFFEPLGEYESEQKQVDTGLIDAEGGTNE